MIMIKKMVSNLLFGKLFAAFSLIELMISLVIISMIAAAFTPVITKKLSSNSIIPGSSMGTIKSDCEKFSRNGGTCHTCFNNACIVCEYENCSGYLNVGKCQCESCTLRSANCIKCNSKECTKCKEHYYLDSGKKCQSCPSGKYCDGSSNPMNCSRINSNCITCSSSSICTKCNSGYYLNSAKTSCTKCEAGNYCNGQTKSACGDRTYAAAGASSCSSVTNVSNCVSYSKTENRCTACNSGYYLSNNTCQKCPRGSYCNGLTKTTCPNGQYTETEGNSSCQTCPAGYYCQSGFKTACSGITYSTGGASSCSNSGYSSNCTTINHATGACLKCNSGYYLSNGACVWCPAGYYCINNFKTACSGITYSTGGASSCANSGYSSNCTTINHATGACSSCNSGYKISGNGCKKIIDCSGTYFMQVGNLCVTKYNMGDSSETSIPGGTATIVKPGQNCNSTGGAKCCWKGNFDTTCNSNNGSYSGCNRTVCNWVAANAICANYNKKGEKWRLPTYAEMTNWKDYSLGKGNGGLMLCDDFSGNNYSSFCNDSNECKGTDVSWCHTQSVWGANYNNTYANKCELFNDSWHCTKTYVKNDAFSVRCVTDM